MEKNNRFILLDANFILVPAQLKVDIYREFENIVPKPYQLAVVSAVFDELEHKIQLRGNKSQLERNYHISKQILDRKKHQIIKRKKHKGELVDDIILTQAIKLKEEGNEVFIATNDKELRKKARNQKIKTIYLRKGKKLEIAP